MQLLKLMFIEIKEFPQQNIDMSTKIQIYGYTTTIQTVKCYHLNKKDM